MAEECDKSTINDCFSLVLAWKRAVNVIKKAFLRKKMAKILVICQIRCNFAAANRGIVPF